jgi:hypothetical protein
MIWTFVQSRRKIAWVIAPRANDQEEMQDPLLESTTQGKQRHDKRRGKDWPNAELTGVLEKPRPATDDH